MGYRTQVHHTRLRSEYNRIIGQEAQVWMNQARQLAIMRSPRQGGIKTETLWSRNRAHKGTAMAGASLKILWNLSNDASYAHYVHEGTNGYTAPPGKSIWIPRSELRITPSGGSRGYYLRVKRIRGQKSQPWMRDAMNDVLKSKGLRPIAGPSWNE